MSLVYDARDFLADRPAGWVFTAGDLHHLGTPRGLSQALARLAARGDVRRIDRGVFGLPRLHPARGPLWPSAEDVAAAVARRTGSAIKPTGPVALNILAWPPVPARPSFLTDGPSRRVRVGRLVVELRHAGPVEMLLPDTRAGAVIVAFLHLGPRNVIEHAAGHLALRLGDAGVKDISSVRANLPDWLTTTSARSFE